MHRIDSSTVEADKFGAGKDGFTEGDPSTGTAATQSTDDWLDAVQEEIVAPIEYVGLAARTSVTDTRDQLLDTLKIMFASLAIANFEVRTPTVAKTIDLNAVASDGATQFCAVGDGDGADSYILTSPDGKTWTEQNPAAGNFALKGVAYDGSGLWVAVGAATGADPLIVSSPDGAAWTARTPTVHKNVGLNCVAHDQSGLWVAVGGTDGADTYLLTSPDGVTWTEQTTPGNFSVFGVAYGNGLWVGVGANDGADSHIITSPDGVTWTEQSAPSTEQMQGVVYNPDDDLWVAVGATDGADATIYTSQDGVTWTEQSEPTNTAKLAIAYGAGVYLASSVGGKLIKSVDGVTWVEVRNPFNTGIWATGIAFDSDNGVWVVVGDDDGTDAEIMSSFANPII